MGKTRSNQTTPKRGVKPALVKGIGAAEWGYIESVGERRGRVASRKGDGLSKK